MRFPILAQDLAASLRASLRQAEIDFAAFSRPLALCELGTCRATCCHDGVVLDPEELRLLGPLTEVHREKFASYGIQQTAPLFVERAKERPRTATRPSDAPERALDFPDHFPKTRCVFLDATHRCAWQRLALDRSEPPWFYKPVSCWMFPISLVPGARPRLTVAGEPHDPQDFATNTPCGRLQIEQGRPAHETLREELRLLGEIAGRDFGREILAEGNHS